MEGSGPRLCVHECATLVNSRMVRVPLINHKYIYKE